MDTVDGSVNDGDNDGNDYCSGEDDGGASTDADGDGNDDGY